jgi:mono/diheme cytochrome c family protein
VVANVFKILIVGLGILVTADAASAQTAAQVARGQAVYTEQKCAVCHSIAGQGNRRGVLDTVGSTRTGEEIRQWLVSAPEMAAKTRAERKPAMRAYTNLPKEDVDALVAYLQTLKR